MYPRPRARPFPHGSSLKLADRTLHIDPDCCFAGKERLVIDRGSVPRTNNLYIPQFLQQQIELTTDLQQLLTRAGLSIRAKIRQPPCVCEFLLDCLCMDREEWWLQVVAEFLSCSQPRVARCLLLKVKKALRIE